MTAIALKIARSVTAPAVVARRRISLRRFIAHRWDLIAVLSLLGSSAAYGVYTLCHLA